MAASARDTSCEATFNQNQNLELKINLKIIKVIFLHSLDLKSSTVKTLVKGLKYVQS